MDHEEQKGRGPIFILGLAVLTYVLIAAYGLSGLFI